MDNNGPSSQNFGGELTTLVWYGQSYCVHLFLYPLAWKGVFLS